MRSSDSTCIPIISISEHFETLMDKNVMYKKIGQSVSENPQADGQSGPKAKIAPTYKTTNAHQRIKKKKVIVSFPPTAVVFMVMIFVKFPQKTVHNVFMGKPRHKFHNAESGYENQYPKHCCHCYLLIRDLLSR